MSNQTIQIFKLDSKENVEQIIHILEKHQHQKFSEITFSFAVMKDDIYQGGLTAKKTGNRVHISLLAIKEENRGSGLGSLLLEKIELIAKNKSAKYLTVNTQDYQGLGFYQKYGFTVFGELTDCPVEGTTKYFLKKELK